MEQKAYIERLKKLTDELQAAGNARPYDPNAYNRIVAALNTLTQRQLEAGGDAETEKTDAPSTVQ